MLNQPSTCLTHTACRLIRILSLFAQAFDYQLGNPDICLFTDIFRLLLEKGRKHPYTWHSLRESANNFSLTDAISFMAGSRAKRRKSVVNVYNQLYFKEFL